ncbi:hypothetical protein Tco_0017799 [Tanacetum coccineum]
MSTYLKNMGGYKHTQLKNKSFEGIQMLFEKEIKRVNLFLDMDAELVKGNETIESEVDKAVPKLAAGSSKRAAEEELDQESSKRQKTGESSELAEEPRDKEADELEGNRHLHAGREGVSIVKRNSYIDAGSKALGGSK